VFRLFSYTTIYFFLLTFPDCSQEKLIYKEHSPLSGTAEQTLKKARKIKGFHLFRKDFLSGTLAEQAEH